MKEINKNIAWVEPNMIYSTSKDIIVNNIDTNQDAYYETIPPMENYCVAVDLEVEIMERGKGGISMPKKTILVSWTSSNDKSNVTFFQGTKHTYGNNVSVNYLTSSPTTFGTFEEVKKEGTNECFGINSIDIQYNSYMVPEVTIEFTDIRGISLFSPEELRHSGVNEEGIGSMVDNSLNIASSFFKCFFTFPYPRFKLMVKGFYGEPTSYELTVSDFRTRFDCTTGNFAATAKFVGYAYSLLNDITMNALTVAPLSDYIGKQYWEDNVKNGRFSFEDNTQMQRLDEIIQKTAQLKENLEKLNNESHIAQKSRELDIENQKITIAEQCHDQFFVNLSRYFATFKVDGEVNNPIVNRNNKTVVLFLNETNSKEIKVTDEIKSNYNRLKDALVSCGNSLDTCLETVYTEDKFKILDYTSSIDTIKYLFKDYTNKVTIDFTKVNKCIIYDGSNLNTKIESIMATTKNAITTNQKELDDVTKKYIIEALSFNPTVENITKLLFAHFETLMNSIYYCINSISERTSSSLGIETTDIVTTDNVGPFPRVDIKSVHNGIESVEESWLGELIGGVNEPEVQLVEGLLKAVGEFKNLTEESSQILLSSGETINNNTVMEIPITPLDIIMKTHPFSEDIDFTDISDVIGKVALRLISVFNFNNIIHGGGDATNFGIADAYNFKARFPHVGKYFLDRLCGGNQSINSEFFLRCLRNFNKEEKGVDNKWAWDSANSDISQAMIDGYELILYDINKNDKENCFKAIPATNFNWANINSTVLLGITPTIGSDFVTNRYVDGHPCDNIFKLDSNYKHYSVYKSKMGVDGKQFGYVDKLKMDFNVNDYLEQFYYDDNSFFSKKLTETNVETNFNPYDKSFILPNKRPLTKLDAISVKSFSGKTYYDKEFKNFKCKIHNNERKIERNDYSFKSISDIDNLSSYTIPSFKGVKVGDDFTDEWSIFGQKEYYSIDSDEGKALVFLDTLKLNEEYKNSGGIRFDNYAADFDNNITAHILKSDEPFMIMPYLGLILLGGYYWRENELKSNPTKEPLCDFLKNEQKFNIYASPTTNISEELFNLRKEIKDILIDEFKKWVKNGDNGFKMIQSAFELKDINFVNDFIKILNEHNNNNNISIEEFLYENASDSFYENYISFKLVSGNLKLYNRETSTILNTFVNQLLKPCMVIKPTKYIVDTTDTKISVVSARSYLDGFIKKLKELYQKDYETAKSESSIVNPINTSEHIKINLYKYLKILYDKWLSGCKFEDWLLNNFYYGHWYIIDSFYNKIGDRVMINMPKLAEDVLYSQRENGYSLLSFISKAYASNRFAFHCVQNFMDLKNEQEELKFKKMFTAIPYNEIDFKNINHTPAFILMYTYEYSSKLDIKDAEYKNDGFNLDESNTLPTQITSKKIDDSDGGVINGYKIPAFAVTYGKQYQHFFKNIDISTDNPIVTEEAIKTQFMIANMNSKTNGENGKKIEFLGQDLYTVYSNNSYTCTVKMMGCGWIQPLMYFQLNNIPMFRGAYLIQKVSHHIEPGNMETTFVGVRMAKQTNKLVDEPIFANNNDQVDPQVREIYENTLAEVTNDCKYAFYNPNIDTESASMPIEDLDLTLEQYITKYGYTDFNQVVLNQNFTSVKHLLGSVIKSEAEGQDDLGLELVAVVLFNRYMHFGKNLTKMFWDSQHALNKKCEGDDDYKYIKIAIDIFTKSPSILEGKKTNIQRQIPILYKGEPTSNLTQPVELTLEMLKSMDGYCTTRGYHLNGEYDGIKKEPKGWWHDVKYICQHDGGTWGHVFVAGAFNGVKEYWKKQEKVTNDNDTSNPSEKAIDLFNSIKKTIDISQAVKCDNISMEKDNFDRNAFYIVAKPEKTMIDIFDAIVNTYYDYFSQCNWIVNNDGKENPIKIRVKAEENATSRIISIAKIKNDNTVENLNAYEDLNPFFYTVLKKRYGVIDTNNKEVFKSECMNFNKLISSDVGWVEIVNNYLNNKIEPCGGEVNLPIIQGYQWDGDNSLQNQNKPTTRFPKGNTTTRTSGYNPSQAAENAKNNALKESIHKCAAYVARAMIAAGAGDMSDRPLSACAYSKFMQFWGFKVVYEGFGPSTEGYTPQHGDVSVIAGTYSKPHGHIQIYHSTDKKWYSDFGANTVYCYRDKGRPYIIYRWDDSTQAT